MEMQSSLSLLPRRYNTCTKTRKTKKLVPSLVVLVRPLDSPKSPPWMVVSAEPWKGVIRLINPITRTRLNKLDLTKFRTTIVATGCHIVDEDKDDERVFGLFGCRYSDVKPPLILLNEKEKEKGHCRLFATFDDGQVRESCPFDARHTHFQKALDRRDRFIDDIINYKGEIYALTKNNELFVRRKRDRNCRYCQRDFHFCKVVVSTSHNTDTGTRMRRRKRLVVSSSGHTLYMVDPDRDRGAGAGTLELHFNVYELDISQKRWCRVSSFKDKEVMFVTFDYCFFVAATQFPGECRLNNCIIFSDDAFPQYKYSSYEVGWWKYPPYKNSGTIDDTKVAIFSLESLEDHPYSMPLNTYPHFPLMLWSPPPWILSEAEKKDGIIVQSASGHKSQHGQSNSPALAHLAQGSRSANKEVVTLKKFQGIDVLPDHLPILENLWMKHGDVVGGMAICSSDTKSMALTSLAKILLILDTNNRRGHTLAKDQAQYLYSTFYDLQYMNVKVDWLAPSVKKALAATYKREQLMQLDKAKAKAEAADWNFLVCFFIVVMSVITRLRNTRNRVIQLGNSFVTMFWEFWDLVSGNSGIN